jgi:hypothetical protein
LGISGFQIEIEQKKFVARFYTSLWKSRFGITNFDALVMMIYKNWPSDARKGCSFAIFVFKDFYFVEAKNLDEHEDLGEANYFQEK